MLFRWFLIATQQVDLVLSGVGFRLANTRSGGEAWLDGDKQVPIPERRAGEVQADVPVRGVRLDRGDLSLV